MALSEGDRTDTMRKLIQRMFVEANQTATMGTTDIKAAIDSIDDSFDALPTLFNPVQSVLLNINARLPEPFKSTASIQEKALAIAFWAMKKGGLI